MTFAVTLAGSVQSLVWVAGGVTALGVIWRKVVKPALGYLERIAGKAEAVSVLIELAPELKKLPFQVAKLVKQVAELREPVLATAERTKTLEPNGGSSMADKVNQIAGSK